jgi:hypothetical protein
VDTQGRMRARCFGPGFVMEKKLFSTYSSASVLVGILAAATSLLPAIDVRPSRGWWGLSIFFVGPVLLLLPGIVTRSWKRLLAGFALGAVIIPTFYFTGVVPWINGRETLPLTVFLTPGVGVATPYYDGIPLGWKARAFIAFLAFWFVVDMMSLCMRDRGAGSQQPALMQLFKYRVLIRFDASVLSSLVVAAIYPFSWYAKLSGTSHLPIQQDGDYLISLAVFALIFPSKLWLLNYLYPHLVRRIAGRPGEERQ